MSEYSKASPEPLRAYMTLDELANAAPIPATQSPPASIEEMLRPDSGVYIKAKTKPAMGAAFVTEEVPGAPGIWRLRASGQDEEILTAIPGGERTEVKPERLASPRRETDGTPGYRPPWAPIEFLPRLVPFRSPIDRDQLFLEPRFQEAERFTFPWQTIGLVFANNVAVGTGVLVGPNLMMTAGHVLPWDTNPWSMKFVPGFRAGPHRPEPFGISFVSEYRGFRPQGGPTGYDYAVCRLFNPLGQALGWMGSACFGNWDDYTNRRYFASGYPDNFANRPAVQLDMAIVDIDGDDPGLELEFPLGIPLGGGWSGGPLWEPNERRIYGIVSGRESDVFDPTRHVISAGNALVDLVRFGLDNWRP